MLSAIISSDYLEGMHIQKALDYSNLKTLVYKSDFQVVDHYDFLYHDGFFVFLKNPTEKHLNFCIHLAMITSGKPMFVLLEDCKLSLLNSFKESLNCRIFIAPFPYRRIVTLFENQRGPFLDIVQKYKKTNVIFELEPATRDLIITNFSANDPDTTHNNSSARIKLNNKEFFILKLLFSNQERIVSKIDLFEYVWGKSLLGSIATVDTHMSKLRRKIKCHTAEDPIKTIPCAGYMLK